MLHIGINYEIIIFIVSWYKYCHYFELYNKIYIYQNKIIIIPSSLGQDFISFFHRRLFDMPLTRSYNKCSGLIWLDSDNLILQLESSDAVLDITHGDSIMSWLNQIWFGPRLSNNLLLFLFPPTLHNATQPLPPSRNDSPLLPHIILHPVFYFFLSTSPAPTFSTYLVFQIGTHNTFTRSKP